MTIKEAQDSIVEDFCSVGDSFNRYTLLIELSKELPALDECYQTDDYLVKVCQSRVWLHVACENGNIQIHTSSDTLIIRGILALIVEVLSGHTPEEVAQADLYFFDGAGISEFLTPERSAGMAEVIRSIKAQAAALI